jgi:hypothetical protein
MKWFERIEFLLWILWSVIICFCACLSTINFAKHHDWIELVYIFLYGLCFNYSVRIAYTRWKRLRG